jgi:hypothetical protein
MSIQIRFSEIAKQDLRDIWRGLAEYSGLSFADSTLAKIGISGTLFPHRMVPVTTNDLALKPTKFTKVVLTLAIIGGFINFALLISGRVPFSK